MLARFLIGVLVVFAACDSEDERKARQLEESRRMANEAATRVWDEERARLEAERKASDEERARLERFDMEMAGRRLVQRGLAQGPDPARTCERIVDAANLTSIRVTEHGLEVLARACQAGDAQARACLAYLVDEIHNETELSKHIVTLMEACVKHDSKAFTLPE